MVQKGTLKNAKLETQKTAWSKPLQELWKQKQETKEVDQKGDCSSGERQGQELMRIMLRKTEPCEQMQNQHEQEQEHEQHQQRDQQTRGVQQGRELLQLICEEIQESTSPTLQSVNQQPRGQMQPPQESPTLAALPDHSQQQQEQEALQAPAQQLQLRPVAVAAAAAAAAVASAGGGHGLDRNFNLDTGFVDGRPTPESPQLQLARNNVQEVRSVQPPLLSTAPFAKPVLPFLPPPLLAGLRESPPAPMEPASPFAMPPALLPPATMIGMPPAPMLPAPMIRMPSPPILAAPISGMFQAPVPPAPIIGMPPAPMLPAPIIVGPHRLEGSLPPQAPALGFQQGCQSPPPNVATRFLLKQSCEAESPLVARWTGVSRFSKSGRPSLLNVADTVNDDPVANLTAPLPVGLVAERQAQYASLPNSNSSPYSHSEASVGDGMSDTADLASESIARDVPCYSQGSATSRQDEHEKKEKDENKEEKETHVDLEENDGSGPATDKCGPSSGRSSSLSRLTDGTHDGSEDEVELEPFVPKHCIQAWEFPLSKSEKQLLYTRLCDQERTAAVNQYVQLKRRVSISHSCGGEVSDHSSNESERCEDEDDRKLLVKQRELERQLQSVRTERRRLSRSRP